jgi:hypothetical protein
MASRKQQRKRQKERRHEYELVVVDETGEERPIDPAELRAKRREKEAERAKERKNDKSPARGARSSSSRPVREVKPPSWERVWKRAAVFAVFMFLVLNFIGKHQPLASRIALPLIYSALFVPFLYLMDRVQYRQYLRRTGQEDPTAKPASRRPDSEQPSTPRQSGRAVGKAIRAGLRGRRR